MNKYEMVVVIVLVVVAGGLLKHFIASRSTRHQRDTDDLKRYDTQRQHITQLEKRIEVLEHILTSDGYELKQRFKDLKHDQQETI